MPRQKIGLMVSLVVMIIVLALPQVSSAQNGAQIHIVRQGETLTSIANLYRVSVDALIAANHLTDADMLYVGERLTIPLASSASSDPPNQTSQPVQSAPGMYSVQRGDTLTSIAGKFGVSVEQLAAVNKITDPSLVVVGRVLKIPGATFGSAAPVPASPFPDGQQSLAPLAAGPAVNFQIVNGQLVSLTLQTVSTGHQSLPLSCEAKVASQLAMMYGLNFDEVSFQDRLPHSLDPKRGFVGSVNGRFYWPRDVLGGTATGPGGYGVHVEGWRPTFQTLSGFQVYLLASDPDTAKTEIDDSLRHGFPVAVWAILGFRAEISRNSLWVGADQNGTAIDCGGPGPGCHYLASGEHAYLILGRSGDNYLVYDPGNGGISYQARDTVIVGITALFAVPTGSAPGAVVVPTAGHTPDLSRLPAWQP